MAIPDWFTEHPGSESWWQQQQQQGLPRISPPAEGECEVTFLWRDPQGDEETSDYRHVWINITGITDHHQKTPALAATRCWHGCLVLANDPAFLLAWQLLSDSGYHP